ncbi:LacI family DNA-binding transcriptional regulator [Bacillus gobiensis]|uniref:LacI family DNA-binding transcriptional regulator n=1 Tax=Bacillus gobiensis TaxID=1441095 RepID=UPI003D1C99D1
MANIRKIAELAGVSISTVSRVLNDHPYVKEEKRKKVLNAMEQLEYTRNIHAVHLSKGFSNMIGVVLPTINIPYFAGLLEGIAEEAETSGMHLAIYQTNYLLEKERYSLEQLKQRQIDGLIICSKAMPDHELMEWKETGPIVLCQSSQDPNFSSISIPHHTAFRHGLDYLISKGHRKIGIALARKKGINSHYRIKAYQDALEDIGEPYKEEWVMDNLLTMSDGETLFHRWVMLKEKPTAMFVANDQVSAGMLLEAQKHSVPIPDDLAILSCDNQEISRILGISTIEIQTKEMGKRSFSLMKKQLKGDSPEHFVLPYRLIERLTV